MVGSHKHCLGRGRLRCSCDSFLVMLLRGIGGSQFFGRVCVLASHVIDQVVTAKVQQNHDNNEEPSQFGSVQKLGNGLGAKTGEVLAEIKGRLEFVVGTENLFRNVVLKGGSIIWGAQKSVFGAGDGHHGVVVVPGSVPGFEFLFSTAKGCHENDRMDNENKRNKKDPDVGKLEHKVNVERDMDKLVDQQQDERDETKNRKFLEDLSESFHVDWISLQVVLQLVNSHLKHDGEYNQTNHHITDEVDVDVFSEGKD
mmetsp:Transcript_27770/g.54675  ORF Transcript_27770/g.54675 Transcript_27770/m.54675 type:complete len:255 (-) Transcript_27770:114-878(-)